MYALDGVTLPPLHVRVSFGELLRSARARADLTQSELAARLGVQQQAVNRWENDRDRPRPETVRAIARELRLTGTEVAAALGYIDPETELENVLRLPAGVVLTEKQQRALDALIDTFIDDLQRRGE